MRPRSVLFGLVLLLPVMGCDVIYERPEPGSFIDFGEPYAIGFDAASAPAGTPASPYVDAGNRLVVDVRYRADCEASRFTAAFEARDARTAEVWLVHQATPGSCATGAAVTERVALPLPARADEVSRLILLTPDQGALVLERVLD